MAVKQTIQKKPARKPLGKRPNACKWETVFLKQFAEHGVIGLAAKRAKVDRSAIHRRRDKNSDFRAKYKEAFEASTDKLEDLAFDLAKEKSERMIMFLLRSRRPELYGENRGVQTKVEIPIVDNKGNKIDTGEGITVTFNIPSNGREAEWQE